MARLRAFLAILLVVPFSGACLFSPRTPEDFAAFIDRTGWTALRPVLPPERVLLFAAEDDRFFRPELVEAVWHRWGEPRIHWYPGSHMAFFTHLPDAVDGAA